MSRERKLTPLGFLAELYANLGVEIHYLAENLEEMGQVIRDVTRQVPSLLAEEHKWDLKGLPQICGDFQKTLSDCERLVLDEKKFSRREGIIQFELWNSTLESELARMRDRVIFHNIKVNLDLHGMSFRAANCRSCQPS